MKIIVTKGPAEIPYLEDTSDIIFRVNGGYSRTEQYIQYIQGMYNDTPILLDLPGDKVKRVFTQDIGLTDIANERKVDFVGMSYVSNVNDILELKRWLIPSIKIIAKIETQKAVDNLSKIMPYVDYIQIDREDLLVDVGITGIARIQRYIIIAAQIAQMPVFLSSHFLISMLTSSKPSIPEVIDLTNTIQLGVDGIQLSEETAMGAHGSKCIDVIRRINEETYSRNFGR